ncbi:MAG: NAD(P)-binding domain-containing protein [Myxococcota bacterium]|nr:NAD(P)-binding domain-containing protein [Myxococcota bacterium]
MQANPIEVAIIGSGPYGLSLAAHLRERGVPFRIFGLPMQTWLSMPKTLNLKSFGFATSLSVPRPNYTFPEYCRARGLEDFDPCSMESFTQYGLWVQKRLVPEVEPVEVTGVKTVPGGQFELSLASGDGVRARRVVAAMGLRYFTRIPPFLGGLPSELASHTSQHSSYDAFKGKDVAVIGAGSSALEAAAVLHEVGGRPQILARGAPPLFFDRIKSHRSLLERIIVPNSVLGQGRLPWLLEHAPLAPRYLGHERRVRFVRTYLGPSGAWWLRPRIEGKVPIRSHCRVVSATPFEGRVRLRLQEDGNKERALDVDHVLAGTGYEPDVNRLSFLDAGLRSRLRRIENAPWLSRNFESSVPGLFFVGPVCAFSFGPLFRFVAGVEYTAPALAAHLSQVARGRPTGRSAPPQAAIDSPEA